jgi:hypothetical protein
VNKEMKFGFDDLCDEIVQLEVLCWCCDVSQLRFGRWRSPAWIGSVFVLSVYITVDLKCRSMCSVLRAERGPFVSWVPSSFCHKTTSPNLFKNIKKKNQSGPLNMNKHCMDLRTPYPPLTPQLWFNLFNLNFAPN